MVFIWLVISKGIPVGTWKTKIGLPAECIMCEGEHEETVEHCFWTCKTVQRAWTQYAALRRKANLEANIDSWIDIVVGKFPINNKTTYIEDTPWEAATSYTINGNTPWDILRTNLLWYLWTQECEHNYRRTQFSLAQALANTWRTTIQLGLAAWRKILKLQQKGNPLKQLQIEESFKDMWNTGQVFCTIERGKPQ